METEENEMFSDDYSTESTNADGQEPMEPIELESTELTDAENYTIIKPRRIIIKATIIND